MLAFLQTAFSQRRCHVVSIPQSILNAVQLGSNANNNILAQNSEAVDNVLKENGLCDKIMGNLAAFQREAVHFVISKNGRALIADEMGLGKTRTAIAAACVYREDWPVLVVCPSSARHHWQSEILQIIPEEMLTPREVTVVDNGHHPLDSKTSQFQYKIIIISYSLVAKMHHLLATIPFNVIIADESHYIKNMNSQRCKCLVPMLQKSRRAILLSGTPALSRPFELFTQLKALDEKTWSDVKDFGRRYCQDARPTKKKSVYNSHNRNSSWKTNIFKGANNTKELHLLLTSTVMIRRLKNDILKQLPPKKRFLMKITIEDQEKKKQFQAMLATLQQYEELAKRKKPKRMAAFLLDEEEEGGGNDFADTEKETGDVAEENIKVQKKRYLLELFDQSGIAKVPAILKHLGKFLDEEFTGKILIFAHHKAVLDQISAFLQEREVEFIRIDGRTASKDRHQLTQKFQNDSNTRAAVLGITAAGIALTLTAASTVFFAELYWTPGSLIQAEDRAHRIGQVRVVNVFYFFAENSIDEILWPLVRKKMKLLGEFVEGHHDADIGALLFTGKKGAQGKQESQEESKPSASSEEVDNDRKDNVASSSSSSQKVKNETDGVEVIEIDLDDEKAPNVFSVVQDEREEELTGKIT